MEDDKQNYDLMGNFVKCLHDTYDKNKIRNILLHIKLFRKYHIFLFQIWNQ